MADIFLNAVTVKWRRELGNTMKFRGLEERQTGQAILVDREAYNVTKRMTVCMTLTQKKALAG